MKQQELLLLFVTVAAREVLKLTRPDLVELLEFIYLDVYPDSYSEGPDDCRRYREKLSRLKDKLVEELPDTVRMLSSRDLVVS